MIVVSYQRAFQLVSESVKSGPSELLSELPSQERRNKIDTSCYVESETTFKEVS